MERGKFESVVLSAMPKLRNIANKIVASFKFGEASDLVQDCVLKLLTSADRYDGDRADVCSLAYVIMNNMQIVEYNRRKVLAIERLCDSSRPQCGAIAIDEVQIRQLLEGCNREARLRYEGYSIKEISEFSGCCKGTVVNRLNANVPFLVAETGYIGSVDRRRGRTQI